MTTAIEDLVLAAVRNALDMKGQPTDGLDGATTLLGERAVIDSIALVTLIVELEEAILERFGQEVILAGDGDVLGDQSPFRTVAGLVAHIGGLLDQA
ncbi:MAG: hypothetical protein HQL82_11235 [Magnetococcales bacterium]|nr:hypothetical protein [Magnetococcales bacterium]